MMDHRGGLKQMTQLEVGFDMSLGHAETNAAAEGRGLKGFVVLSKLGVTTGTADSIKID